MSSKTLTKGMKPEEVKQFQADWTASAPVRRVLDKILQDRINLVRRQRLDKEDYSNPNYAVNQAALNEKERCYQELKDLLDNT